MFPKKTAVEATLAQDAIAVQTVPYAGKTVAGLNKYSAKGNSVTKDRVQIRITNSKSTPIKIALFSILLGQYEKDVIYVENADGIAKAGVIGKDEDQLEPGEELGYKVETMGKVNIAKLQMALMNGSIQLTECKVKVTKPEHGIQLEQPFIYRTFNPLEEVKDVTIHPSALSDQYTESETVIGPFEIPGECVVSFESGLIYEVAAATKGSDPVDVILTFNVANYFPNSNIPRAILSNQ